VGDDVGQGGLAEAGGPVKEDMVEGLPALTRGIDKDLQVLLDPLLPYVF